MGLFGPTIGSGGGGGGGGSSNASIVLNSPDSRSIVTSATTGSVFLVPISGEVEVATNGTEWAGTRTFINCSTGTVNLRVNGSLTGFVFLSIGETVTLTYSGGNTFSGSPVAINHAQVRWSGSSTIPTATTSAAGLLASLDKAKLNNLGGVATSVGIVDWNIVSGTITVNCSASHFCNVSTTITISGSGGIDGTYTVHGTPTSTQITIVPFTPPANASGTGGTLVRGGEMSRSDKQKLDGIASGAQVNIKPDWSAAAGNAAEILNKPTIPAAQVNANWNATSGLAEILNKPTIPAAPVNADWNSTSGLSQILNKPNLPSKVAFGPMIILRFANWGRGQTGYGPGNPPTGMSSLTPTSGNVVENYNPDIYHPRLFNGGQFFGVGRQYRLICAVRCDQIAFDGVHCQLRWFNGSTSQIIPGLMDFGGGNDGIANKSYFATSDTLTAVDEWWTFVPFFGAFNGSNFARIQDCVVVAYLV